MNAFCEIEKSSLSFIVYHPQQWNGKTLEPNAKKKYNLLSYICNQPEIYI